jgi:hypothetical protein
MPKRPAVRRASAATRSRKSGGVTTSTASRKGLHGRFGHDVPPVLEPLGPAEVEHNTRNNRMRVL